MLRNSCFEFEFRTCSPLSSPDNCAGIRHNIGGYFVFCIAHVLIEIGFVRRVFAICLDPGGMSLAAVALWVGGEEAPAAVSQCCAWSD